MLDIFLLPFEIFKWAFSGIVWVFLVQFVLQSDIYYNTRDWFLDRYDAFKEKRNN